MQIEVMDSKDIDLVVPLYIEYYNTGNGLKEVIQKGQYIFGYITRK